MIRADFSDENILCHDGFLKTDKKCYKLPNRKLQILSQLLILKI